MDLPMESARLYSTRATVRPDVPLRARIAFESVRLPAVHRFICLTFPANEAGTVPHWRGSLTRTDFHPSETNSIDVNISSRRHVVGKPPI